MKIWRAIQISDNVVIKEFNSHNKAKDFVKYANNGKKYLKIECIEIEDELTKYKKCLEIIKKYLNIELVYDDDGCEPTWFLDSNCGREIEQEEYELLEQLLNGSK